MIDVIAAAISDCELNECFLLFEKEEKSFCCFAGVSEMGPSYSPQGAAREGGGCRRSRFLPSIWDPNSETGSLQVINITNRNAQIAAPLQPHWFVGTKAGMQLLKRRCAALSRALSKTYTLLTRDARCPIRWTGCQTFATTQH